MTNALGKFENIVAETLCSPSMFPCLSTSGNIVAETTFASQEEKMFPNKFRNIAAETMFPSFPRHLFDNNIINMNTLYTIHVHNLNKQHITTDEQPDRSK